MEDVVGVGHGGRLIDLVGDECDLLGQALHRLLGQIGAAGELVDPARQRTQPVHDRVAGPILRHFLDLAGKRVDPPLDALESLVVE